MTEINPEFAEQLVASEVARETALYGHCVKYYDKLHSEATTELIQGQMLRVYRGFLTKTFKACDMPMAYYSKVKKLLDANRCWAVVATGYRDIPSVVVLVRHPSEGVWEQRGLDDPLTGDKQYAKLRQDVDAALKLIGGMDVVAAISHLEGRIKELEDRTAL